jgi:hypothetical protein
MPASLKIAAKIAAAHWTGFDATDKGIDKNNAAVA